MYLRREQDGLTMYFKYFQFMSLGIIMGGTCGNYDDRDHAKHEPISHSRHSEHHVAADHGQAADLTRRRRLNQRELY